MNIDKGDELLGAYRYVFNSPEGEKVLKDLAVFSGLEPDELSLRKGFLSHIAGSGLTHAECAYRNGQQDLYRYISGMSENK